MRATLALLATLALAGGAVAQSLTPPLTFYAAFDGTTDAVARGDGKPLKITGPVEYRPGKTGQALLCGEGGATLQYATAGNLRAAAGTVEMWVCPLDWTGKEDEFHVFLEALDPGWLVFYRYYQGGILTLTGNDSLHYTSAASPPIDWKPGEWHHLAGTWRARRSEVYVDGKLAGFSTPLLPEKLADAFWLGDRPWHVARKRQTLIDEVKLYSAPLDEASIALAAQGKPFQWQPKLQSVTQVNLKKDVLAVSVDAAGLVGELGAGRTAQVQLALKGQAQPVVSATVPTFTFDVGNAYLPLAQVNPGEYEVRVALLDQAGGEVARAMSSFTKPGPPVWSGNRLGMADKVQPPWTPLRIAGATSTVECWGRSYSYSELPRQVKSAGAELLSAPMRLEAVVSGKTVPLTGSSHVASGSATTCLLAGEATGSGLRATLKHRVEYDGFTWTDLAVESAQPVKVDELRLTWRMPRDQATLMNCDNMQWTGNQAGAIKPEGFAMPHVPYLWLGNEKRGLSWYSESKQNWVADPKQPTIEVRPQGDQVAVTVRLIASPTEIKSKREYGFGLMATPVRPYPQDALRWRMTPGVRPTFDIIWPNGNMKYYGYTDPIDGPKFAERVRTEHAQSCKVVPYINLNFASGGIPEWQYYGSRWADPDRVVTPGDVAEMGFPSMGTCPASRDWQDFILYRINEMIDRYGVDGIYIDCWGPSPCRSAPCGWKDEAGKPQGTYPIRAYRDLIRRVYTLFHERQKNPLMMVHMSSELDMPLLSFTDTILDGEQFSAGKMEADYLTVLSPDQFRAEFLGRNSGPVEFFLPEFRGPNQTAGVKNLAPYLLLHGIQPWPIWSDAVVWNKLYEALDAFRIEQAKFLPYWESPSWAERPSDLLSTYVGKNAALLVDMNTAMAPTEAHVTLDLTRLQMRSISSATDVMSGEQLKLEGNVLTIPQAAHQGRVILLKP